MGSVMKCNTSITKNSCHGKGCVTAKYFKKLYWDDEGEAKQTKKKGCPLCKGKLHDAHYQRKPRGIVGHLEDKYKRCFCYCCSVCRHRVRPPSLRFLGAKVYCSAVVLLRSADPSKLSASVREALTSVVVCRQTVARWQKWWQEDVPKTSFWFGRVAIRMPPIKPAEMPDSLISRYHARVRKLLDFIVPLADSLRSAKREARGVAMQAPG